MAFLRLSIARRALISFGLIAWRLIRSIVGPIRDAVASTAASQGQALELQERVVKFRL
ncbi:hypothetical protein NG726_21425 [Pseudomonas sp. MOB-449]|nr:hypothetical protein [Pseudomonas sp. MOB-449]